MSLQWRDLAHAIARHSSYDSVDKAILDSPHHIREIEVAVRKGDGHPPPKIEGARATTPVMGAASAVPKKSNLKKVTMSM